MQSEVQKEEVQKEEVQKEEVQQEEEQQEEEREHLLYIEQHWNQQTCAGMYAEGKDVVMMNLAENQCLEMLNEIYVNALECWVDEHVDDKEKMVQLEAVFVEISRSMLYRLEKINSIANAFVNRVQQHEQDFFLCATKKENE